MSRSRLLGVLAALAAVLMLALPALASAAGITLNRTPSPPQAIAVGQPESITWAVTYTSVAHSVDLSVTDPSGAVAAFTDYPFNFLLPGDGSPQSGGSAFQTTAGSPLGRYTIHLGFNSSLGPNESTATTVFDVASALGTMTLTKYEDLNGNGIRDPGEPGVPNWPFNLVNPSGGTSTVSTGADGTVTFTGVPAGTWQVGEPGLAGWAFITPKTGIGTFTVPANGTGSFIAGNARPAPLSGIVWVDTNKNGVLDAGEQVQAGVTVTLAGTTGTGDIIGGSTVTGPDGSYVFGGLLPGTYASTVTVPGGYTATTPTTLGGIAMVSNTASPNHNFGIVPATPPPPVTPAGNATAVKPNLTLTKAGPSKSKQGQTVTYTIKVTNPTTINVRNVVVTDPIPPRMTYVSSKPTGTLKNGVVTWNLGTLKPKASRTLTFQTKIDPTAPVKPITNTATATATGVTPRKASTTLTLPAAPKKPRTGGVTG